MMAGAGGGGAAAGAAGGYLAATRLNRSDGGQGYNEDAPQYESSGGGYSPNRDAYARNAYETGQPDNTSQDGNYTSGQRGYDSGNYNSPQQGTEDASQVRLTFHYVRICFTEDP